MLAELTKAYGDDVLPDEVAERYCGRHLLGDKGYDTRQLKLDFDEHFSTNLAAIMRINRNE